MKKKNLKKNVITEGLRFECVPGCRKCCEIPGLVFVHEGEIPAMAESFKLTPDGFIVEYLCRHLGNIYELNMPSDKPCMFLNEDGCRIYPVRPAQCRTFPFWPENVNDPTEWKRLKKMCPGLDRGRIYTVDEILDIMADVCYGPFL